MSGKCHYLVTCRHSTSKWQRLKNLNNIKIVPWCAKNTHVNSNISQITFGPIGIAQLLYVSFFLLIEFFTFWCDHQGVNVCGTVCFWNRYLQLASLLSGHIMLILFEAKVVHCVYDHQECCILEIPGKFLGIWSQVSIRKRVFPKLWFWNHLNYFLHQIPFDLMLDFRFTTNGQHSFEWVASFSPLRVTQKRQKAGVAEGVSNDKWDPFGFRHLHISKNKEEGRQRFVFLIISESSLCLQGTLPCVYWSWSFWECLFFSLYYILESFYRYSAPKVFLEQFWGKVYFVWPRIEH